MSDFSQQNQQVGTQYNADQITVYQTASPLAAPPGSLWAVPYPRNPIFTGREETIRLLHEGLASTSAAVLIQAISGLGGIGKTQTVLEYVYRYQSDYQAVLWVRASSREEIVEDLASIARLLQLPEQHLQDQQQIANATRLWLQTHHGWLLVVDNADDLEMVYDYLPTGRSGHILLTTCVQAVGSIAQKIELPVMPMNDGMLFLMRRADFFHIQHASLEQVSIADRAVAQRIVQELGNLPLAIDQAGAYLEETGESLAGYLALYQQHRKELLARRGGIRTDHIPVATTWSLAINRVAAVNPAAADLMQLCAFLAPDAIAEEMLVKGVSVISPALKQAAESRLIWNKAIEELRKYSLSQRQPEILTLSLHRLVQAVIYDAMDAQTRLTLAQQAMSMVEAVFPVAEIAPWTWSQKYVLDALACLNHASLLQIENAVMRKLRSKIAIYLHNRGQYTEAETHFQQVLISQEKWLGSEHLSTLETRNNLALLYRDQGRYEEAEALFQKVLNDFEQVLGSEHPSTLAAANNLAGAYSHRGKYEEAEALYRKVLTIREKLSGLEDTGTLDIRHNLAILFIFQGKYEHAEALFQQVLTGREILLGPDHHDSLKTRHDLALLYSNEGKYEQAEALYRHVLMYQEKLLGPEHPEIFSIRHNLAILYYNQHWYEQAEALFQKILIDSEQMLGRDHPNTLRARHGLALVYKNQHRYEQATPLFQEILASSEQLLGSEHPDTLGARNNLALLYFEQDKYEQAEVLYRQVINSFEQVLGYEHPDTLIARHNLALLYLLQCKYEQAEVLFQQVLISRVKVLGSEHPNTLSTRQALAILFEEKNNYK